jgi:hypothetical protein
MSPRVKAAILALTAAAAVAAATIPLSAFRVVTDGGVQLRWPTSRAVVLEMQLGSAPVEVMFDGSTTWNSVGNAAAAAWNGLADVNFTVSTSGTGEVGRGNNVNNVFFASTYYGQAFGDAVGITLHDYDGDTGIILESDVVFDNSRNWNSYRGELRTASGGGRLYDLRRAAIHEFGHVLGLAHPDDGGQSVTAIMNSRISAVDTVQQDDRNGLRAIYGAFTETSDRMVAGSTMRGGSWLTSLNGRYRLYMQADSNLVIYDMSNGQALWWTGASAANGMAIFQADGNFVVYDGGMNPIYFTGTQGNPGAFMVLQNDGNLVIYSAAGAPIWTRMQ